MCVFLLMRFESTDRNWASPWVHCNLHVGRRGMQARKRTQNLKTQGRHYWLLSDLNLSEVESWNSGTQFPESSSLLAHEDVHSTSCLGNMKETWKRLYSMSPTKHDSVHGQCILAEAWFPSQIKSVFNRERYFPNAFSAAMHNRHMDIQHMEYNVI